MTKIIKELIDDFRGPNLPEIINMNNFTVEDFKYIVDKYTNIHIYQEYSKKAPLDFILKNLDKGWSWFNISKNENLTFDIFLTLRHKPWSINMLKNNKNFNRTRSIKIMSKIIKLPTELVEIIISYGGPLLEKITI